MKKKLILLLMMINISLFSQEKCGAEQYTTFLMQKYPEYSQERNKVNEQTIKWLKDNPNHADKKIIITIPVVVHVVWNTNSENISDAKILSQIDVLNEDFRRLNADATNTPSAFQSVAADCEIEFCLATIDPQGNPTTGITRTQTSQTSFSISTDDVKYTSSGGINAWPNDDYLNIWVCDLSGGILGYATPPWGNLSVEDGVVIGYRFFGTLSPISNTYNKGRTATHEVGHWLNLDHIWGDANCGNDNCNDTPTQQSSNYGCPNFPSTSNCTGNGANGDMYMNYMDYTDDACMNLFTQNQKSRMIAAINNYRPNLLNHNICSGVPPTPSWDCVNGNCIDPGNSNGTFSDYNSCVNNCDCIGINPNINEDFQSGNLNSGWSINNPDGNATWEITNIAGYNSSTSVYINNADYAANGEYDDLILPTINVSLANTISLNFDYAYSLWTNPNSSQVWSDTLQVFVSDDCGNNWQKIWEDAGSSLVTTNPVFNEFTWTPSNSNDWDSKNIDLSNYIGEDDLVIKFRNINDYENNLFLDNINIITDQTTSIDMIEKKMLIYPNPASDYINVSYKGIKEIYNLLGEVIMTENKQKININKLNNGIYILKMNNKYIPFVKE